MMTVCPACGQRAIGKVGADQYYCWDCCVEFMVRGSNVKIFNVELDGTLSLSDDAASVPETLNLQA
jgi:hypothetical protein